MISMNFFTTTLKVIRDTFLVIYEFWVRLYKVFINFLYKYLPEDVANIFLIMIAVIIVGSLISYFLKNGVK